MPQQSANRVHHLARKVHGSLLSATLARSGPTVALRRLFLAFAPDDRRIEARRIRTAVKGPDIQAARSDRAVTA